MSKVSSASLASALRAQGLLVSVNGASPGYDAQLRVEAAARLVGPHVASQLGFGGKDAARVILAPGMSARCVWLALKRAGVSVSCFQRGRGTPDSIHWFGVNGFVPYFWCKPLYVASIGVAQRRYKSP